MKRYIYNYQTIVTLSDEVTNHFLLLRCQPSIGSYMTIDREHFIISPDYNTSRGIDHYGNRIIYGGQRDAHRVLAYISTGIVSMQPYKIRSERGADPIFSVSTPLTALDQKYAIEPSKDAADEAEEICHKVHNMMSYVPCSTNVGTPASLVIESLQGVCQDYAHLMIGLCRISGIPARYACGFMEGTGATHAWVEIHDGYSWIAFDPTNDCRIRYGYVKIAHGRDAADCAVSRGIYLGSAIEETQINVTLKEI